MNPDPGEEPLINSQAEITRRLHATDEVIVWAEEFCRIFDGYVVRLNDMNTLGDPVTVGTMVTWFANAMEIAKDKAFDRLLDEMPDAIVGRLRARYFLEGLDEDA